MFLIGDLYQLAPVGQVAFMSHPQSEIVSQSAGIMNLMSRIWTCFDDVSATSCQSLQLWSDATSNAAPMTTAEAAPQRKVLDLDVNHRSGADA